MAAEPSLSDADRLVAQVGIDCAEELPADHCALVGLPAGATFDAAAAVLLGWPRSGR